MFNFNLTNLRVVKEEIVDDDAHLPCFNGRVVSWVSLGRFKFSNNKYIQSQVSFDHFKFQLVSAEGSNVSDGTSQCTESASHSDGKNPSERHKDQ